MTSSHTTTSIYIAAGFRVKFKNYGIPQNCDGRKNIKATLYIYALEEGLYLSNLLRIFYP
jgi:hypothetical protein